jgi:hypothetical protein
MGPSTYIRITSGVYYEINNELNIMYREKYSTQSDTFKHPKDIKTTHPTKTS